MGACNLCSPHISISMHCKIHCCVHWQIAERGRKASLRGGGWAPQGSAQERSPRLQVSAPAEEVGEERPERVWGRQRADSHLPNRPLQSPPASRLARVQHGRGALAQRALRWVESSSAVKRLITINRIQNNILLTLDHKTSHEGHFIFIFIEIYDIEIFWKLNK